MKAKSLAAALIAFLFICVPNFLRAQEAAASSHRLGAQDVIEVNVFREPDLTIRIALDKEAKASLNLIGEVSLAGMTTEEAGRIIAARYNAEYLVNPKVSVSLVKEARKTFTVMGAVNKPQSYYFPEGQNAISLLKAVGMAGSFSRLANKKKLYVTRAGRAQPIVVDGNAAGTFQIRPDDVIEVKESIF